MKILKLCIHQKTFSDHELIVNQKDFPDVKIGDVLEIFHRDNEDQSHLLLQVKGFHEDFSQNNTVSVATAVAKSFNLKNYQDVNVLVVNPKDVALDLVELNFKEQYLSRSDMWRLRKSLLNTVVYLGKAVSFAQIRMSVEELWSKGDQVTCGYVTEDTRVTFRSSTAQVNIFIQMSCEMWDFDNYGDLYFEKTVQGFLEDLFSHWKEKNCGHDVTITMFSRTFYKAKSIEEFPMYMRECIQQDYQGNFYEDFYRVVIQNERYDEWTRTIIQLKTLFNQYLDGVLRYHERPGYKIPPARNSTAAEGNFLEVLNMGLNIYEKFYLDRNFDRTGKLSITITPGPGVFEVDRELTHITKQRTIDCGNSCDLVCMGEQPLHVTPLLKFQSKKPTNSPVVGDDYNIPHWINHSFYTSRSQEEKQSKNQFIPRIRMPECAVKRNHKIKPKDAGFTSPYLESNDMPFVDYDEYDAQVFKLDTYKKRAQSQSNDLQSYTLACMRNSTFKRTKRYQYTDKIQEILYEESQASGAMSPTHPINISKKNDSEEYMPYSYNGAEKAFDYKTVHFSRKVAGSCGSPEGHHSKHSLFNYRPSRALINPFAPSRLHFKVTSNRRRWVHAFPRDWQGVSVQPHHQHSNSICMSESQQERISPPTKEVQQASQLAIELRKQRSQKQSECSTDGTDEIQPHYLGPSRAKKVSMTVSSSSDSGGECVLVRDNSTGLLNKGLKRVSSGSNVTTLASREHIHSDSSSVLDKEPYSSTLSTSSGRNRTVSMNLMYSRSSSVHKEILLDLNKEEDHNWMFGVTGEQEWTPEVQTGMDWKSMTRPASLPVTTDFFPDQAALRIGYFCNPYTLVPDVLNSDTSQYSTRKPLSTKQVYNELVYQRIAQGFQIVLLPKNNHTVEAVSSISSSPYQGGSLRRKAKLEPFEEMVLSIGRIFHKVTLTGSEITVTRIWPKHPYPQKSYHYTYRFQVPDSETYDVSWTDFRNEKLENFNWNYVDQYICTKGEEDDFHLVETDKYWRARFFLQPCNNAATRKIIEGAERCDIYEERGPAEQKLLCEGFDRFLEAINKIRRPPPSSRMPKSTERDIKRRLSMPISPMAGSFSSMDRSMDHTPGSRAISKVLDFAESSPQSQSGNMHGVGSPIVNLKLDGSLNLPQISGSPSEVCKLSQASPLHEVAEAMMDPHEGLYFLNKQQGTSMVPLPSNCFVSGEAINWIQNRVQDVTDSHQAITLLQRMTDENLIRHASGNKKKKFVNGFYLYCIIHEKEKKDPSSLLHISCPYYDSNAFQNEWCEVEVHTYPSQYTNQVPTFMLPQLPNQYFVNGGEDCAKSYRRSSKKKQAFHAGVKNWPSIDDPLLLIKLSALKRDRGEMKTVYVDVDSNHLSDRTEWGIARYHAHYSPSTAYEMEIQWLVATGCILGELVQGWARKAGQCGFHFLPMPGDPFALPFTPNSDPLRGPIFVPLNVECLKEGRSHAFEDFPTNTREDRLLLFKDSILKKFGFMPDKLIPEQTLPSTNDSAPPTYIHCSGGMFAMIPDNKTTSPRNRDGTHCNLTGVTPPSLSVTPNSPSSSSSHLALQDYVGIHLPQQASSPIFRPSSLTTHSGYYQEGFLWSWNFMLTKKWRSSNTGDEHFQDKMLADFRLFCSNKDNRLKDYFQVCKKLALNEGEDFEMEDVLTLECEKIVVDDSNLHVINEA